MRLHPALSSLLAATLLGAAGWFAWGGVGDSGGAAPAAPPVASQPSATPTVVESPSATPAASATASPSPTPRPVPADRSAVVADLQALLADPEYDTGAPVGLVVLDEAGRPVVQREPDVALLPASTMKLVTAAAVFQVHAPDDRLQTPVFVRGEVSERGTLDGDVVVRGVGDPSLATREYQRFVFPARPAGDTSDLAGVLQDAGVWRITGDVVVDPGAFADERTPAGWRDVYLSDFDARYITGLTVDAGLDVTINHPIQQWDRLRPEDLEDDGIRVDLARDPVVRAAEVLRRELHRARMSVEGAAVVGRVEPDDVEVGALASPPLADLLRFMVKESDNHIADTLLRHVGAQESGRSTWQSSAQAVRDVLADVGIDLGASVIADGSGLSRDDRLSAGALARLDQVMSASEHGEVWGQLQAIAGRDGTLRRRLRGTIAEGRFRGKTGTLSDVRALVGAVEGPDGRRYHLAAIGNGGEVWRVNTLVDQMILRLTRSLWCDGPGAPAPAQRPADLAVACPA